MPIDKVSDIRRLPRLGKIRLGIKKEGRHGSYPQAVDYFVCPDEVKAVHGPDPRELPVMFPSDDLEDCAPQYYKCYSYSQGLICKGDGLTCRRKIDVDTGDYANRDTSGWEIKDGLPCDPDQCPMMENKQCKKVMSLLFILPEVPGLGVYQLDTSSFHSIVNMNSQLAHDGFLRYFTKGRIAYIPLVLSIEPQVVTPPGVGRKTVHILNVRAKVKLAEVIRLSRKSAPEVLLPGVAEEEPPDDLFPEDVIGGAPETPTQITQGERREVQPAGAVVEGEELPYLFGNPSHPVEDNCNCPKPVPVNQVITSPDGTHYHKTCGGYLCTPPIDCYPGCPHMPLEQEVKAEDFGPEVAREAEIVAREVGQPGQPLQLGEAAAGKAALSSPVEFQKSAERAPGPEAAPELGEVGEGVAIDLQGLKETMKRINWTVDTAKTWLASQFKVSPQGTLTEVLARLTREQAERFVKEVDDRAARVQPGLFE